MPKQDAQGRWISDDGRSVWDGSSWKPLEQPAPQQPSGGGQEQTYGLPQQSYGQPQQSYGQPQQSYGQPQQTYGQPQQQAPAQPGQQPGWAQMAPPYSTPGTPGYPTFPGPASYAGGYQAMPKRRSGMAIWSLGLGIASLVFWLLPIAGLPVGIAGLITGLLARSGSRRGMALAGLICSIIGIALSLINAALGAYLALNKPSGAFFGL